MAIPPNLWARYYWPVFHLTLFLHSKAPKSEEVIVEPEQDESLDKGDDKVKTIQTRYGALYQFLQSFPHILPCDACKFHCLIMFYEHPWPNLDQTAGTLDLFRWGVDRHNEVNKRLGKRELSYEEALKVVGQQFGYDSLVAQNAATQRRTEDQAHLDRMREQLSANIDKLKNTEASLQKLQTEQDHKTVVIDADLLTQIVYPALAFSILVSVIVVIIRLILVLIRRHSASSPVVTTT